MDQDDGVTGESDAGAPAPPPGPSLPSAPIRSEPLPTWVPPDVAASPPPPPSVAAPSPAPPPTDWVLPASPPTTPLPFGPSSSPAAPVAEPAGGAPGPTPTSGWGPPSGPDAAAPPTWAPPGAAGTPASGPAPWGSPGSPGSPPPPTGGWPAPLSLYPVADPNVAAGPSAPPKRQGRVALAILSVTAVLAASTFAVFALTRPDGAASPEAAVEALFAALEAEDAIGVMESLPPGEREVLLEPMIATVAEFQRLGLLDSFELEDVPGTDIEVDGLTLSSTELGDGVTSVRVTGGTITGTVIPDEVPIGPRTRELAEREGGEPIEIQAETDTSSLADANLELVTVEADGGWHVSLFYTIAEGIRGDDTPLPPFGAGITPIGADTPEGAVRGLIEAGIALDLERAVGSLPPDEMRVLYDYAPLFLDEVRAAADDTRADGFTASLDRLDLRSEGDGETRRVMVDGMDIRVGISEGEGVRVTSDGTCTVMESTYRTYAGRFESVGSVIEDGTVSGGSGGGTSGRFDDEGRLETTRMEICEDGRTSMTVDGEETQQDDGYMGGMDPMLLGNQTGFTEGLTVVEHDGRWYVSPVRSMFDSFLTSLRGMDGSEIDAFFESFDSLLGTSGSPFEELETTIPGSPGSPGTTFPGFDPNDPYVTCSEVYDRLDPDATEAEWEAIEAEYDQCLLDEGVEPFEEPETLGEPRIAGGHVLVPTSDSIRGYTFDGSVAWEGPECSDGRWATLIAGPVRSVEVASCEGELVGVDGTSGAELWRIADDMATDHSRLGPTALVRQNRQAVVVTDLATGQELWSRQGLGDANVASDETTVYISTNTDVGAYDLRTGAERWLNPGRVNGLGVANGILIARDDQQVVQRLDPVTGSVVWASEPNDVALHGSDVMAFTAGTVTFQSTKVDWPITVYDLETGAVRWSRSSAESVDQILGAEDGTSLGLLDAVDGLEVLDAGSGDPNGVVVDADVVGATIGNGHLAAVVIDDDYEYSLVVVPVP